jgi:hypothetical protein
MASSSSGGAWGHHTRYFLPAGRRGTAFHRLTFLDFPFNLKLLEPKVEWKVKIGGS